MARSVLSHPRDKERLLDELERDVMSTLTELASYGADKAGGVTRLLYTEEWLAAQRALAAKMSGCGLEAEFDEVGNLFGRLQGEDAEAPAILTGSHIDTVVQGGMYDGAYGIAAGLAAVAHLKRNFGRPKRALEVVSLCEEEGSRFPMAYWGSGSIVGKRDFEQIAGLRDARGVAFSDAMTGCGFGESAGRRRSLRSVIGAFVEAHIEQGAVLETEGACIGVVEAIAGQRRLQFEVTGEANHAGTTPMRLRRDALEGASAMMQALRREALRRGDPLVATVGRLQVQPNVPNVVPGKVSFTVDARHVDGQLLARFCEWVKRTFERMADERGLRIEGRTWFREEPVPMDAGLTRQLEEACGDLAVSARRMASGAGHDAQMFAHRCRTAMLFVPSRRGISHSPEEYTEPRELAAGALVLTELLYRIGYGEERLS
ncbi:allantoate deiminase [Paenibacillus arenilitoris]|uniref:Allantoate deiminase n=1 Tax=Paenibacillus arenilitoris TaxID=2772299 RepID=A0A927CNH4_9BACL|nr:allantoate deiminase [Paenibacillus arenilitoris]MBD2871318.1 allantoate deiminase [Paenibacillus arenilitoris]